ncbi:MAG: GatB/YqeY domain-containing protein [Alphaproteobacteria bacterium]|nr:GatB/YqeY domain-containing protein [Alphaproteobacteria bacterium]
MLRASLNTALKEAMKARQGRRVSTLRLILAALKDRDIAARGEGRPEGLADDEILNMLATMIRQRKESIEFYRRGAREDLAAQEEEECAIIEGFLPRPLSDDELLAAAKQIVAELGAKGLKDMGRTMTAFKARYPGRADFGKAAGVVKELLS